MCFILIFIPIMRISELPTLDAHHIQTARTNTFLTFAHATLTHRCVLLEQEEMSICEKTSDWPGDSLKIDGDDSMWSGSRVKERERDQWPSCSPITSWQIHWMQFILFSLSLLYLVTFANEVIQFPSLNRSIDKCFPPGFSHSWKYEYFLLYTNFVYVLHTV